MQQPHPKVLRKSHHPLIHRLEDLPGRCPTPGYHQGGTVAVSVAPTHMSQAAYYSPLTFFPQ